LKQVFHKIFETIKMQYFWYIWKYRNWLCFVFHENTKLETGRLLQGLISHKEMGIQIFAHNDTLLKYVFTQIWIHSRLIQLKPFKWKKNLLSSLIGRIKKSIIGIYVTLPIFCLYFVRFFLPFLSLSSAATVEPKAECFLLQKRDF